MKKVTGNCLGVISTSVSILLCCCQVYSLSHTITYFTIPQVSDDPKDEDLPAARSLSSFDETSSDSVDESLAVVVAPPDTFLGDDSSTPTPMLEDESLDSGKSTPRFLESPSTESLTGKSSPLVVAQYRSSDDHVHTSDSESTKDQNSETDSRQPLSPLTKASYSSAKSRTEYISGSQSKGLSIYPSPDYNCQPAKLFEEEKMVSYTLSREGTAVSLDSEDSPADESLSTAEHCEGTDL